MKHIIELDDYEVANLQSALAAAGYPATQKDCSECGRKLPPEETVERSPLWVLNSGDWIGQIQLKLPYVEHKPNVSPAEYAVRAKRFR